jgi:hypothetical protein
LIKLVIKLGKIWFAVANTLAYFIMVLITIVKSPMVWLTKLAFIDIYNLVL